MTLVTLRPDGTDSSSGVAVTGAASAHAAVTDESDSSYVGSFDKATYDYVAFTLDDLTLPAGAVIKALAIRARAASAGGATATLGVMLSEGPPPAQPIGFDPPGTRRLYSCFVNWSGPTTITLPISGTTWHVDEFAVSGDDAHLTIYGSSASNPHLINVYEMYVDVTYVEQPVVNVTAPSGTITGTNLPTVEWENTLDTDGGGPAWYSVKIVQEEAGWSFSNTPVDATGTEAGGYGASGADTSWTPTTILPDGTYRAYVVVAQVVNGSLFYSEAAYAEFTIDVALPAVPTLTLTEDANDGRIVIDLDDNAGDATTDSFELQRSTDGGTTWEAVRLTTDTAGIVTGTSATVYDYEAPNGVATMYRARARHAHTTTLTAASAWATGTVTFSTTDVWLKAPERPSLNVVVQVDSYASRQRPARRGVFQPLGATYPIVVRDTRQSWAGSVRIRLDTDEDQAPVDALIDSGLTLLLQVPDRYHEPDHYIQIGDQDRGRLADKGFVEGVIDTLGWVEVAAPTGVVDAWPAGTS